MMLILVKEKCYVTITKDCALGIDAGVKKQTQKFALTEIMMRLTDDVARQLMELTDLKKVWDTLDEIYLANNIPNTIDVIRRLFNYRLDTSLTL